MYDFRNENFIKIRFEKVATIFHARKYPEYNTFESLGDHYRTSIKLKSEEHQNHDNQWFLFDDANVFNPMENQTDTDEHFDCGLPIAMVFKKLD